MSYSSQFSNNRIHIYIYIYERGYLKTASCRTFFIRNSICFGRGSEATCHPKYDLSPSSEGFPRHTIYFFQSSECLESICNVAGVIYGGARIEIRRCRNLEQKCLTALSFQITAFIYIYIYIYNNYF